MSARRTLISIAGVLFALLLLLGAGLVITACAGSSSAADSFTLQETVLQHLEDSYYQPVDAATLEEDAINGMVAGLDDPYTVYLDPTQYQAFTGELSGSYTGIGLVEGMENGFITTLQVFKGSPAAAAGIKPGDIIVSVDGGSTAGLTIDQVVTKIQGPTGTTVKLGMYRPPAAYEASTTTTTERAATQPTGPLPPAKGQADVPPGGTVHEYTLERQQITEPQVDSKLLTANGKKVADITLYIFSKGAADAVRAAVTTAVDTDKVAAIILDLRNNGGGLVDEGVGVASVFIPSGVIVTTRGLHSPEHVYDATGGAFAQIPLYLLVNQNTASASEIVAGALQDYKRATLIGVTTFGKGVVQSIEPLSNGGAVKVTTAEYFTPNGRNINKTGIVPGVVVAGTQTTPEKDTQLQEALKLIGGGG